MEILFLSYSYKTIHHLLVQGINECLEKNNFKVSNEYDPSVKYGCILVFNRKALEQYKAILKTLKAPVIYFFCLSDIVRECSSPDGITHTLAFKDKVLNLPYLSSAALEYLEMILPVKCSDTKIYPDRKRSIFVHIEDEYFRDLILLKILPLLNQLYEYKIYCQSSKGIGTHLINQQIKFVKHQQQIEEWLDKSDTVIGSGLIAYEAILRCKKTIIVGEKGYGGLVTEENLGYHLSHFFQGRNGGKFDEYIPLQLLWNAIGTETPDPQKIIEKLSVLQAQNEKRLISLIEKTGGIAERIDSDKRSVKYILNPVYEIIKKQSRNWLSKQVFNKLHKSVNESERAILLIFRKPYTIPSVLTLFPVEYTEIIEEYIDELIRSNILIPAEPVK